MPGTVLQAKDKGLRKTDVDFLLSFFFFSPHQDVLFLFYWFFFSSPGLKFKGQTLQRTGEALNWEAILHTGLAHPF